MLNNMTSYSANSRTHAGYCCFTKPNPITRCNAIAKPTSTLQVEVSNTHLHHGKMKKIIFHEQQEKKRNPQSNNKLLVTYVVL